MIPQQDFPGETLRRIPLSLGFMRKIAPTFPKSLPYRVDKKQSYILTNNLTRALELRKT